MQSKRLLLAVDGSERALQTVRYAGEEDAFKGMKIVVLHVFNSIPDAVEENAGAGKTSNPVSPCRSVAVTSGGNQRAHRFAVNYPLQ